LSVLLILAGVALGVPASAWAQEQVPARVFVIYPAAEPQADSMALSVFFTITDESGRPIPRPGIETVEIQLLEGNTTPVPASFSEANSPFYISLLLDASGSMASVMPAVREAAQTAIDNVPPNARVAVFKFNELSIDEQLRPIEPFTNDMVLVKGSINAVDSDPNAPTCLYNALYKSIEQLDEATTQPQERQAIILFTDGKDERADGSPCSQRRYDDVINRAVRDQPITPIHAIGLCADASCSNIKREEIRGMAKETSAFAATGSKENLGQLFGEIMNGLNSQLVARANVYPRQGEQQAVLKVKLRDSDRQLTTTFNFFSDKDYAPPPPPVTTAISSIVYDSNNDVYQLALSVTSPDTLEKVVVEVWDEKGGTQVPPAQEFENPGELLQFERNSAGLVSGREYSFRVKAVDNEGFLVADDEGETTLDQKVFVYEPPQADVILFTIKSVRADFPNNQMIIDLDVPQSAEQVNSFEGFIVDEDTGAGVYEFEPTLFSGSQIIEGLPAAIRQIEEERSYRVTLFLTDKDGRRLEAEPYEFKAVPPPPPGLLTRIFTVLQIPLVLATVFAIILCAILLVIYWNRPARKEKLPSPMPRPPVDHTVIAAPRSSAEMARLQRSQPAQPVPAPRAPQLTVQVLQTSLPLAENTRIVSQFPFVMGRSGCDFNFSGDQHISRRHVQITCQGNTFYVADLGSSNGVFIGGVRLPAHTPTPINGATTISLGQRTQIRLEPQ
jgi:hypothetical protein